jgi:hypothetical protein
LSAFYRLNLHNRRTGPGDSSNERCSGQFNAGVEGPHNLPVPPAGPVRSTPHYLT